MDLGHRLRIVATALTLLAMGLLWAVGSGEAQPAGGPLLVQTSDSDARGQSLDSERETLYQNIKLFNDIAFNIENRYMDQVDAQDMIRAGIRGMLSRLDPFSTLMERRSYDQLMENTSGKYQGVGMQIDVRNDTLIVVSPIEGTPAYRLGLTAGDRIIAIDSESTEGMTTEDAAKHMRGPAGTEVVLTILRPGIAEPMDYHVERAVIELKSVNYYGVTDDNIGYVRLNRFAETTHEELREALTDLKQRDVKGVIFDLRSNGGGLLDEAVATANFFLPKDRLVVYTRGREPDSEQRFLSTQDPIIGDKPLVVLVNGGSASASEIVAGALQDWDRGLIMGQTTFGKGLVQQVFNIGGHNSDVALKLTTARYYVPSGRSIQKPSNSGPQDHAVDGEEPETETPSDSSQSESPQVYYTAAGRPVYGGGGIVPDVDLPLELYEPIEMNLERQGMFFSYAVPYVAAHPDLTLDFEVTDDILNDFKRFIAEKNFTYSTALELDLQDLKDKVAKEHKDSLFADALAQLEDAARRDKEDDFDQSRDYIRQALKRTIIRNKFGERGVYEEVILKEDPGIKEALRVLRSKDQYQKLLTGPAAKGKTDQG
jgi:carboxyl-terminal processing protease